MTDGVDGPGPVQVGWKCLSMVDSPFTIEAIRDGYALLAGPPGDGVGAKWRPVARIQPLFDDGTWRVVGRVGEGAP